MSSALNDYCGSPFWVCRKYSRSDFELTWNTTDPDFTSCFQKTVLVWTPCAFLWLFSPLEILFIIRYPRRPLNRNILNVSKFILILILMMTQVVDYFHILYYHYEGKRFFSVDFYTPIIKLFTLVFSFILMIQGYKKGKHTSGVLFIFWLLFTLCSSIELITFIKRSIKSHLIMQTLPFVTYCIFFISLFGELILSAFADVSPAVKTLHAFEHRSPQETSSFLSRLTFSWFDRLVWLGFKRPITVADLWSLKDFYKTENVSQLFDNSWAKEIDKSQRSISKRNLRSLPYESLQNKENGPEHNMSIMSALWRTFGTSFCICTFLKLLGDLCGFAVPLLLQQLISFVESKAPLWQGIFYVVVLCVGTILESQFLNQQWDIIMILSLRVKSALISAVYKKSLKISNSSKRTSTVGEIVNLMSVDVQRMSEMLIDLPTVFTFPIQISLAMYMLWRLMGVSVLISLSVFVVLIPINAFLARKIEQLELLIMEYKDERVKMMNEVLVGIKVLKFYAWEPSFNDQITAVRKKELNAMKSMAWMNSLLWFLFNCSPYLIALTMFTAYVLIDETHVLTATRAFVSLSLLHIIQEPLSFAPVMIAVVVQMRVSIKRLNHFMNLEELDDDQIDHNESDNAITIENGTFSWQLEGEPTLREILLKIPKGSLVAVVGPVGAGKSSLLMAMLGEMEKLQGKINTYGSIAYVPQIAWIQNATLKDNIIFGKKIHESEYNNVIDACALRSDLAMLPGGDMTEIGEKGINLSGGQKQRVSLARAVYNDADIYLLDDPLSAVDSHVGKHIFNNVIGPQSLLKYKTRVLVTHGLVHLSEVDFIIMLEEGKIVEQGSYQELLDKNGVFTELLKPIQKDDENTREKEPTVGDNQIIGSPFKMGSESEKFLRQFSRTLSINSVSSDESLMFDRSSILNKLPRQISIQEQEYDPGMNTQGNLISSETIETGKVGWDVYCHYLVSVGKISSIVTVLLFMVGWAFAASTNVWLSFWSNDPPGDTNLRNMRLGVYGGLCTMQSFTMFMGYIVAQLSMIRASRILHETMLLKILRSPMSFFDVTPLGRIINRFSHDVDTVDSTIPNIIIFMLELFFQLIGIIVIICMTNPIITVVLIPVGILYYATQKFYIATSRQLKRIASNYRSPIYSHFSETLSGLATIRAFRMQQSFIQESNHKVDENHKAVYPSYSARRWLTFRLDFLGTIVIFSTALFAVMNRDSLDPGTLGLSVSYAVTITFVLNWFAKMMSELETYIVSVERIKEYSEIQSEALWKLETENISPSWPQTGSMSFVNYSTRYRQGLDLVLKGITCDIQSGEKIGVVGRTGAGKSSLTLALFRIIEADNGKILIDGIDIAQLGLHSIRSRLTIIPQDPILFCSTLRMNLDPFDQFTDQQLWYALEHSHLKEFVSSLEGGLQYPVAEGGENLSVGQRQLLCLARALLRKSKILILDEATAAVDLETDDLIQTTIRKEFADCTIITIAHRLNTIMDSTRVLVLQNGVIKEFDSPETLLQNPNSIFYSMAKDAGIVQ